MAKIIVIDNGNYVHGAIFAHMNNEKIPAIFTYLRMIIGDLKRLNITLLDTVIIAHDYSSWRKKFDQNYKAQRKQLRESKKPEEWWISEFDKFNKFYPIMNLAFPFHHIKIWNCEADDIASTVCKYNPDTEKIMVSRDKDLHIICARNNVKIFNPKTNKFVEVENPYAILQEKINTGDKSDNLSSKTNSQIDYDIRKKIVDLINIPVEIENPIVEELKKIQPKNLRLEKIFFKSVREQVKQLYNITE